MLFAAWQIFNHYSLMGYLMGRLGMSMVCYHYSSFMVEMLLVAMVALSASRMLMAKNRQLEELQRQKDTLTHTLVHGLRQPLTAAISGLSSVTGSRSLPDDGTCELVALPRKGRRRCYRW